MMRNGELICRLDPLLGGVSFKCKIYWKDRTQYSPHTIVNIHCPWFERSLPCSCRFSLFFNRLSRV